MFHKFLIDEAWENDSKIITPAQDKLTDLFRKETGLLIFSP